MYKVIVFFIAIFIAFYMPYYCTANYTCNKKEFWITIPARHCGDKYIPERKRRIIIEDVHRPERTTKMYIPRRIENTPNPVKQTSSQNAASCMNRGVAIFSPGDL